MTVFQKALISELRADTLQRKFNTHIFSQDTKVIQKRLQIGGYTHNQCEAILCSSWDFHTGGSYVLDGGVKVTELSSNGPLIDCINSENTRTSIVHQYI